MKWRILSLGLVLATLAPALARADVGPPAHLRISEREPGRFVAQWRVPKALPPKAVPVPDLPESCEPLERFSVEDQAGAWLLTQEWRCDGGLAGEIVGLDFPFADLALTTVVRVDLLSGDRFAHLSTPGDEPWRLPEGTAAPDRLRDVARAVGFGVRHVVVSWVHLPFILVAGLLGGLRRSLRVVSAFTLGQVAGVIVAVPLPGLGVVPAEMVMGLTAALLAREALRMPGEGRRLAWLTGAGGFVHGLAVAAMLAGQLGGECAESSTQLLAVLGMDAGHLVGAAAVAALAALVKQGRVSAKAGNALVYACGAAGMAMALGLAVQGGTAQLSATEMTVSSTIPGTRDRVALDTGSRQLAPSLPEAAVQSFVIVEPFEMRHEVMFRPGRFASTLGLDPDGTLELQAQAVLSEQLIAFVLDGTAVQVDGLVAPATSIRADFMTVDSAGALPRATPVPERVSEAVVGVVLTYPVDGMPRRVSLSWNVFPAAVGVVPVAVTDPESTRAEVLTAADPTLTWENNLAEDPIPTVAAVTLEPPRVPLPILSLSLLACAVLVLVLGLKRRRVEASIAVTRVILALSLVLAPFLQLSVALPAFVAGAPSERQARRILAGLLPNIYRAMQFRDEGLIFDRLAVSVTGETLTEVYLEQRRTLELEERGGAQARVEAVEILDASEIERQEPGFRVRATWTAAGMVTHFGHRHFRQNRYDARLTIVPVQQTWKIRLVEMLEQDRLK